MKKSGVLFFTFKKLVAAWLFILVKPKGWFALLVTEMSLLELFVLFVCC